MAKTSRTAISLKSSGQPQGIANFFGQIYKKKTGDAFLYMYMCLKTMYNLNKIKFSFIRNYLLHRYQWNDLLDSLFFYSVNYIFIISRKAGKDLINP